MLDGQILRIPDQSGLKIPHIGWNSLHLQNDGILFAGLEENPYVYFVHSYYLKAADEQIVKANTLVSYTHLDVYKRQAYLVLLGTLKNGNNLYMRAAVESIRESASIKVCIRDSR